MLNGFEEITSELTEHEESVLAPMILSKLLCHKGRDNAIRNRELVEYCGHRGHKVAEPRIRKIIEFIRLKSLLEGLVAKRFGYFIAENPDEILAWVETMKQRRAAIDRSIFCAMRTVKKMKRTKAKLLF